MVIDRTRSDRKNRMKTTFAARMTIFPAGPARRALAAAGVSLLLCLLSPGCQTALPQPGVISQASVVFQYNSQDYIFITKPSYREGEGYLRQIRRPEVAAVMNQLHLPREPAVVALPWRLEGERLQAVLSDWNNVLKECGFRRAVFVRSDGKQDRKRDVVIETRDLT